MFTKGERVLLINGETWFLGVIEYTHRDKTATARFEVEMRKFYTVLVDDGTTRQIDPAKGWSKSQVYPSTTMTWIFPQKDLTEEEVKQHNNEVGERRYREYREEARKLKFEQRAKERAVIAERVISRKETKVPTSDGNEIRIFDVVMKSSRPAVNPDGETVIVIVHKVDDLDELYGQSYVKYTLAGRGSGSTYGYGKTKEEALEDALMTILD